MIVSSTLQFIYTLLYDCFLQLLMKESAKFSFLDFSLVLHFKFELYISDFFLILCHFICTVNLKV